MIQKPGIRRTYFSNPLIDARRLKRFACCTNRKTAKPNNDTFFFPSVLVADLTANVGIDLQKSEATLKYLQWIIRNYYFRNRNQHLQFGKIVADLQFVHSQVSPTIVRYIGVPVAAFGLCVGDHFLDVLKSS